MQKFISQWIAISLLVSLIACGGASEALISQAEIDSANRSGTLNKLYDKASDLVTQSRGGDKKEAIELQSKIAKLLVNNKTNDVEKLLSSAKAQDSQVTRSDLKQMRFSLSDMQQWSSTSYTLLTSKIDQQISVLNAEIEKYVAESEMLKNDKVASILVLKQAAEKAGAGESETERYESELEQTKKQLAYQGSDALEKRLFSTALEAAKSGLMLDPGSVQFESLLSQAQAGLFEKDFRFALENGKPESAYQSLLAVADEPIFLQLRKSMGKSIILLANYFANAASQSYQKGDLLAGYNSLTKARAIQSKVGGSNQGFIQEKKFLDLVMARAKNTESGVGKRFTLLKVIQSFDPAYPGLNSEYLKLMEQLKLRAMTKLSVESFKEVQTNNSVVASVGRRIGSKLEKILFENLGNEVLIVTEISEGTTSGFEGLALNIDGEVLQAAIETKLNKGQRSKNVQIGVQRIETEEYAKWSKRKRGDAPKQFNEVVMREDVILTIEHIRKLAIAEVAFRIIEPASGKLLLTDNVLKEAQFSGESINEFQKGDFHQQYVPADLPSDIKIMDELATELATQVGEKLSAYLENTEGVFYDKFADAKAQNDVNSAVEFLANGLIIAQSKSLDKPVWESEIIQMALR